MHHIGYHVYVELSGSPSRDAFFGTLKVDSLGRLLITQATVNNIIRFYLEAKGGKVHRAPSEAWLKKGGKADSYNKELSYDEVNSYCDVLLLGGVAKDKSVYPMLTTSYLISLHPVDVKHVFKLSSFTSGDKKGKNILSTEYVPYAYMYGFFTLTYTSSEEKYLKDLCNSKQGWSGSQIKTPVEEFVKELIVNSLLTYRSNTLWVESVEVRYAGTELGPVDASILSLYFLFDVDKWYMGKKIRDKQSFNEWKGQIEGGG